MKEEISGFSLEHANSIAEEKDGRIEIVNLPASGRKIYLIYKACEDCIHWDECKEDWGDNIDTNKLARNCENYEPE